MKYKCTFDIFQDDILGQFENVTFKRFPSSTEKLRVSLWNVRLSTTRSWTLIGLNMNIKKSNLDSLDFALQQQQHLVENTKITIHNSSFGSLDLGSGTKADITNCNVDARLRPRKTLIVAKNASVTIKDCQFERFRSKRAPTILYGSNNSEVIITSTVLSKNRGLYGVVFLHDNCSINVENVHVSDNIAYGKGFSTFVFWNGVTATITNAHFDSNMAFFGGSIWAANDSSIECVTCIFNRSEALQGGAIMVQNNSRLALNSSMMLFNEAKRSIRSPDVAVSYMLSLPKLQKFLQQARLEFKLARDYAAGGAIVAGTNSNVISQNTSFYGNKAEVSAGALLSVQSSLVVHNSLITSNSAAEEGGAILFLAGKSVTIFTQHHDKIEEYSSPKAAGRECQIENSHFVNNYARNGGCVLSKGSTNFYIHNSSFIGNAAVEDGGALNVQYLGRIKINHTLFTKNTAIKGGALLIQQLVDLNISKGAFLVNSAELGTAIHGFKNVSVRLEGVAFEQNHGRLMVNVKISPEGDNEVSLQKAPGQTGGAINIQQKSVLQAVKCFFRNNTADNGGAILLYKYVSANITACNFIENSAERAGAVYLYYHVELKVALSMFTKNNASFNGGAIEGTNFVNVQIYTCGFSENYALQGGAVNLHTFSQFNITNSHFVKNAASLDGGALALYYRVNGTISYSNFYNNTAGNRGGAVLLSVNSKSHISNATFAYNTANFGGAMYTDYHVKIYITNGNFIENHVQLYGGSIFGRNYVHMTVSLTLFDRCEALDGGVIYLSEDSDFFITHSNFTKNNVQRYGGAVMIVDQVTGTFRYCDFFRNTAKFGGALATTIKTTIWVQNTTMHRNHAISNGGSVIGWDAVDIHIDSSNFTQNSASNGGAVGLLHNSSLQVSESNFAQNRGHKAGGAMVLQQETKGIISGCHFLNNTARSGGAIHLQAQAQLKINHSVFSENFAHRTGGSIGGSSVQLHVQFAHFILNKAESGGALYLSTNSSFSSINSSFVGNKANISGGVMILLYQVNGSLLASTFRLNRGPDAAVIDARLHVKLHIDNCSITNNTANEGSILHIHESDFSMTNSNIGNNSAAGEWTALKLQEGTSNISTSIFANNTGGATYLLTQVKAQVSHCNFTGNTASVGASIIVHGGLHFYLINSVFGANHAEKIAGAVLILHTPHVQIQNSTFINNFAPRGGAILVFNISSVDILTSNFTKNKAEVSGGAIYVKYLVAGKIHLSNFHENTANVGGAVFIDDSVELHIHSSSFQRNYAEFEGGAAQVINSSVYVSNCTFSHNFAIDGGSIMIFRNAQIISDDSRFVHNNAYGGSGGTLYIAENTTANISNCMFTGGMAGFSGAIHVSTFVQLCVANSYFSGNQAEGTGGVLTGNDTANVKMENCTCSENLAKFGGVLSVQHNSTLWISDSALRNNTAEEAGAIFLKELVTAVITNCAFISNSASATGVIYSGQGTNTILTKVSFVGNTETGGSLSRITSYAKRYVRQIDVLNSIFGGIVGSGAVLTVQSQSKLTINDCQFLCNSGVYTGTVLLHENVTVIINNSHFTENTADYVGVFEAADHVKMDIIDTSFKGNEGTMADIGILLDNSHADISNFTIAGYSENIFHRVNIYVSKHSTLTVRNSVIGNITAGSHKYHMFHCEESSRITLKSIFIEHNQLYGIACADTKSTITIENCKIAGNIIGKSVVIVSDNSTALILSTVAKDNMLLAIEKASSYFHVTSNSTLGIHASKLKRNEAVNGSLISVQTNSTFIGDNNDFVENVGEYGGVLKCHDYSSVNMIRSSFTKNNATECGGVLYCDTCNIRIVDNNMTLNEAQHTGGCVVSIDGPLQVCM